MLWTLGLGTAFASEPFDLEAGARALGMGGAYSALAQGPKAAFWNPASVSGGLFLSHGAHFQGLLLEQVAAGKTGLFGKWSGALSLHYLGAGDIKKTQLGDTARPPGDDNPPEVIGTTSYGAFQLGLALGNGKLGARLKLLYERADEESAFGGGLDLGLWGKLGPAPWALVLRDAAGTPLVWTTGRKEVAPPSLWLSAAPGGSWWTLAFEAVARAEGREGEAFKLGDFTLEPRLGAEARLGPAALRAGFRAGSPTLGAGVSWRQLAVDYAFLYHTDLGASHRLSLSWIW